MPKDFTNFELSFEKQEPHHSVMVIIVRRKTFSQRSVPIENAHVAESSAHQKQQAHPEWRSPEVPCGDALVTDPRSAAGQAAARARPTPDMLSPGDLLNARSGPRTAPGTQSPARHVRSYSSPSLSCLSRLPWLAPVALAWSSLSSRISR